MPTRSGRVDRGRVRREAEAALARLDVHIDVRRPFLDQVNAVSDRITVLRNGRLVSESLTKDLPRLELVGQMVGGVHVNGSLPLILAAGLAVALLAGLWNGTLVAVFFVCSRSSRR